MYVLQHCFIFRPSDCTASEDAEIEPRIVATSALALRRYNDSAKSLHIRLDLIHSRLDLNLIHSRLDLYLIHSRLDLNLIHSRLDLVHGR